MSLSDDLRRIASEFPDLGIEPSNNEWMDSRKKVVGNIGYKIR